MNVFVTSIRVISVAMLAACALVYLYVAVNLVLLRRFRRKNEDPAALRKRYEMVFDESLPEAVGSLHRMTLAVYLVSLLLLGVLWLFGSQAEQLNLHPAFLQLTIQTMILACLALFITIFGAMFQSQGFPGEGMSRFRFKRFFVLSLLLSLLFNAIYWFVKL